jgi:hypothetical protein
MNDVPVIDDLSHGMMRRVYFISTPRTFKMQEMDVDLPRKPKRELSGIFNWAFRCTGKRWHPYRHGRLWRSVKYEDVYLRDYNTLPGLHQGLETYLTFYNRERPYQSLWYLSPAEVPYAHCESIFKVGASTLFFQFCGPRDRVNLRLLGTFPFAN